MNQPIVRIIGVEKAFRTQEKWLTQWTLNAGRSYQQHNRIHALNGVDLTLYAGETLCVVGETGCGKSTLARVLMGLMPIDRGEMYFQQHRLDQLSEKQRLPLRRQMQMIFQNPYASLNPRMTIYQALFEPVAFHNPQLKTTEVDSKIESLLDAVGISAKWLDHYPHEFSGGQRQRISIARALSVDPSFIVADEPLAALDVSVQAQVLNLLMDLQQQRHLTYLFITHDLAVVEHFATRVAVMYLGRICELAPRDTLFSTPRHPYTQALLAAIPRLDSNHARPIRLIGEVPTIHQPPIGCVFQARCPLANQRCYQQSPNLITQTDGSQVACHAIEEGRTWK